jgi:hypothetical protein
MPKFTFICDHNDSLGPGPKLTYESERVFIDDVLFDLQDFLKGCGFVFDGELTIVPTDEIYGKEVDEINTELEQASQQERESRIFESPDHGQTVFSRPFGTTEKEQIR